VKMQVKSLCLLLTVAFATVLCMLGEPRASAESQSVSGVIAIGGNAEERDRAAVSAGVTAATRVAGWQLPAKPLSKKEAAGLLHCLDPGEPWACIPGTIDAQGIHHALVVAAEKRQSEDGSPMVVLTAKLIVNRPRALVVHQRFCEHCTDDKLTQASSDLAQQLVQELAVRVGRTVLEVKSMPAGAQVTLDGEAVGATNMTFNTYPGSHVVIIEKAGYLTQTIPIQAEEGKTAEVSVALRESETSQPRAPEKPTERPSHTVPIALIGAGGAAVVTAGVLVYLGQQDGPDDKYKHTHATTLGIVTGLAGAAAIGAGVYLWLHATAESAPTVATIPHGAIVGWTRSF
jgi:hypothetical protein